MRKNWSMSDLTKSDSNQKPLAFDSVSNSYDLSSNLSSLLLQTSSSIRSHISRSDPASLSHLLSHILKRNHLGLDNLSLLTTRGVADIGRSGLNPSASTKIDDFHNAVVEGIQFIKKEKEYLITLKKAQKTIGNSALMLSGGGSITMYHIGVVKTLIEAGIYEGIPVISGTSGGSITAAFCATLNQRELLDYVCQDNISTDYRGRGDMKEKGIEWFPSMWKMAENWVRTGKLVEDHAFLRTTKYYWGDTTFEEAYNKTRKHVCMTVTASRAASGGVQRLLLNHITTPHVTIASAVAASCALPGIMASVKLQMKLPNGEIGSMEVDGVEWIDGSIQADVPFQRVSQLFNVSNFIVSQCNFHVVPFLPKSHHPDADSSYWRLFQLLGMDIRSRVTSLSNLGLFPSYFGNDISKVFKQKYSGDVTIVPRMRSLDVIGIKAFMNPTVADMQTYIKEGAEATYAHVDHISHLLKIEREVNEAVKSLSGDKEEPNPIINGILSILGLDSDTTHLRTQVNELEAEVRRLRAELQKNNQQPKTANSPS
ncbi:hypothetical protein TrST_g5355 [Triparma strigata]|uniref:PNPLA domain-containing protein n=1 Tax=Triparma strigata TaxID=1606541 RepID=A0A9W7B3D0_9STRA|nr:hypothetical protein TrST_g5355 [Triparma strigata]